MNIFALTNEQIAKLKKSELIETCRSFGLNNFVDYKEMTRNDILQSILNYKFTMKSIVDVLTKNQIKYLTENITYMGNLGFYFDALCKRYEVLKELNFGNEIFISDGSTCCTIIDVFEDSYILNYKFNNKLIEDKLDNFILKSN